jgi:hypothetical protein
MTEFYALKHSREEGRRETAIATAAKAFAMGIPIEQISALTGLDRSEIENLQPEK